MSTNQMSVELRPEQVAELRKRLSVMRHNVNNHLSLVLAAAELIKRKPELTPRLVDNMVQQPESITAEIRAFSDLIEALLDGRPLPGVAADSSHASGKWS